MKKNKDGRIMTGKCEVPGCDEPYVGRASDGKDWMMVCQKHYEQFYRGLKKL